jgi:hypothetical protein
MLVARADEHRREMGQLDVRRVASHLPQCAVPYRAEFFQWNPGQPGCCKVAQTRDDYVRVGPNQYSLEIPHPGQSFARVVDTHPYPDEPPRIIDQAASRSRGLRPSRWPSRPALGRHHGLRVPILPTRGRASRRGPFASPVSVHAFRTPGP